MKYILLICIISISFHLLSNTDLEDKPIETSDQERIILLLRMVDEYLPENPEKAEYYCKQATELAHQIDEIEFKLLTILSCGNVRKEQGKYIEAFIEYQRAIELAEINEYEEGIIDSYISLGKFYRELLDYDSALKYLFMALDRSSSLENAYKLGSIQMEMSYNYRKKKEYVLCREYGEAAAEIFRLDENYTNLAGVYILLGKTYMDLDDYETAFNYANEVLRITEGTNDLRNRSLAFNDLAWNYFKKGDFQSALEYNYKALEVRKEADIYVLQASSFLNIADLHINWGKYDEALESYQNAWEVITTLDSFPMKGIKRLYYQKLSDYYILLGNFKKGWQYFREFYKIDEELKTITNDIALNNIKFKHELERYEKEKSALKNLHISYLNKQKLIIIAILIITAISGFFLYSKYRLRKKLSKELVEANKRLQSLNEQSRMEIVQKRKMEKLISAHADHMKLINRILRHDIANDLVTIKSGLKVFKIKKDEQVLDEIVKRIEKSSKLIYNMREFEEFMGSHGHLKVIEPIEILKTISENYNNIKINVSGSGKVMAEDSLSSVLENLIRNAIDHAGVDTVDINISCRESHCVIKVSDNGSGIPDNIKKNIFDEGFSYGKSSNTGMGLFIVKQIIESFGGYVNVQDNDPQGTTFVMTLRAAL